MNISNKALLEIDKINSAVERWVKVMNTKGNMALEHIKGSQPYTIGKIQAKIH